MDLLSGGWSRVAVPAATALICLASALVISSLVFLNKGAKMNAAWSLIAVGLLCIGVSEGDAAMTVLGLPNLSSARDLIRLGGASLVLFGVAYGRSLIKRLLK